MIYIYLHKQVVFSKDDSVIYFIPLALFTIWRWSSSQWDQCLLCPLLSMGGPLWLSQPRAYGGRDQASSWTQALRKWQPTLSCLLGYLLSKSSHHVVRKPRSQEEATCRQFNWGLPQRFQPTASIYRQTCDWSHQMIAASRHQVLPSLFCPGPGCGRAETGALLEILAHRTCEYKIMNVLLCFGWVSYTEI